MTDLDALRLAVLADPDDDLPRLVYADCLEESGDADRAAFIRAQIELARQPEYEPFPVYCKTRKRDEWIAGEEWLPCLWPLANAAGPLLWNFTPFRRGFGWSVFVTHLSAAEKGLPALLAQEPVGELHLGTATLDQWRQFASSPWLSRIRSIILGGLTSPNEPLRALRNSSLTSSVRSLQLEHTNIPSLSVILEDLFASPLGRQLTALSMRLGQGSADESVEAIASGGRVAITDYDLNQMGFGPSAMRSFVDSGLAGRVEVLRLVGNPVMHSGVEILATAAGKLRVLDLSETYLDKGAADALAQAAVFRALRKLVLNGNPLGSWAIKAIARSPQLAGLRSLGLAITRCDNAAVRYLTRGTFWPNLVELDLTGNPISDAGAKHLMTARPAPEMTSLRMTGRTLADGMKADLREKFGEAVGFAE